VYLVWNLRNVGYQVEYTHPNLMLISWRSHDEKYKAQESPWALVLGAAREQVLQTVPTSAPSRPVPRTATATIKPMTLAPAPIAVAQRSSMIPDYITATESENKRKSILKKTTEYRPYSAQPAPLPQKDAILTGTLTPRHISFV
jgi:hypothetical protein